jgi:beta-galactosidase/beta-glucuronidase
MEDKFLVVVKDDLNIVRKQRLCESYSVAQLVQGVWKFYYSDSDKEVEIQLLSHSAQKAKEWAVITLPDNWG